MAETNGNPPAGERVRETYFEINRSVENRLGLRFLTPEYEIVSVLFDVAKMTPLDLLKRFSGSNTAFYKILGDLEAKGALSCELNPADRRSKLYRLSDLAEAQLSRQWRSYKQFGREESYGLGDPNEVISRYTRTIRTGLKVNQFTAEFQILLHIYSTPGISNIEFSSLVDVSQSKFNDSLRKLKESGHIYYRKDTSDRRRKSYYLPNNVSEIFNELDRRIFEWLDTKVDRFDAQSDKAPPEVDKTKVR